MCYWGFLITVNTKVSFDIAILFFIRYFKSLASLYIYILGENLTKNK